MTEQETKYLEWFASKPKLVFEMYTNAGDKKCQQITVSSIKKIFSKKKVTKKEILEHIGKRIAKVIDKPAYEEITDTEPPYIIQQYVMKAVKMAGYNWEFDSHDVLDAAYKFKNQ